MRKRPAKTSTSAKVAREPLNDQPTKELSISRLISECNYHMRINYVQAMKLINDVYAHGGLYSFGHLIYLS